MIDLDRYPPFFGVRELARILQVGEARAYELCKRKGFPCLRLSSRTIRISRDGLKEWVKSNWQ